MALRSDQFVPKRRPYRQSDDTEPRSHLPNSRRQVEYRAIGDLLPMDGQPRRYSRAELRKAENIIRQHGVIVPLLIGTDSRVLNHFIIVVAARNMGLEQLPVIVVDQLTESEAKRLSLATTNLYQFGRYDQQLLGAWLVDIELTMPELSFDTLGFEQGEVDRAIGAFKLGDMEAAEPALAPTGPPVSRIGDIYLLGRHRVGVGDAADPLFVSGVMGDILAAMVFADPPYGCEVGGFVTTRAHRDFVQGSGKESDTELSMLFFSWCRAIRSTCMPGALVYLCIDWRKLGLLQAAAEAELGELINLIVWSKDRAGMGSLYRSQHELILLLRVPGDQHRNNVQLGKHGRNRSNVWAYPSAATFGKASPEGDLLADHPTPKNKEMIADAILDCTKRGDVVFDPFLGSGSTLIAAEKTGRTFCGSDLDPLYADLAIRRWQAWTGLPAVHAETGELFDDRARAAALASTTDEGGTNDE